MILGSFVLASKCLAQIGFDIPETVLPDYPSANPVLDIVMSFLNWLLAIFGVLAVISFVISGFQYLIASGREKMIDTAKRNMTYSVIGIIIALSGLVIIYTIDSLLGGGPAF